MKKIALTPRLAQEQSYYEIRDALDVQWAEFLSILGYIPLMIPTKTEIEVFANATAFDGILLTGGNDLSQVSEDELSELRDKKESEILDFAIRESIPVFGVCRGMQFIAAYFGSTFKAISNHVAVNHAIEVTDSFWGSDILAHTKEVNSYHQYGIDELDKDLKSIVVSDDGSTEAFIHKDAKIFGQMWHPEREDPFRKPDLDLVRTFFEE